MKQKRLYSILLVLALLCTGLTTATAQSTNPLVYGAYESGATTSWGTLKIENCGVAMQLKDPSLVGLTITKVRIPFEEDAKSLGRGALFLSKELKVEKGAATTDIHNVADILVDSFAIKSGWLDITLSQPYTITEDGVYVGYTFSVNKNGLKPVRTVDVASENNLWVFSNRTYKKWSNKSQLLGKSLAMQVLLTGAPANAASVSFTSSTTQLNAQPKVKLTITNHGTEKINSIDYTYEINGISQTAHKAFSPALSALFGKTANFDITLPKMTVKGARTLTVTIDKVNDQANEDKAPADSQKLAVYSEIPKKRALVEEYTGTWCGWCPRGFVALEMLDKELKEDFIGVAYHSGDPMAFTGDFPIGVDGFPRASLDRVENSLDPYGGKSGGGFGMKRLVEERNKMFTPVAIKVEAYFEDEAQTIIQARSTTTTPVDLKDAKYQVGYILVANGLTEAGDPYRQDNWAQHSYLPGMSSTYPEPDFKTFTSGGSLVTGLTYNFVACARSSKQGIAGSLPTEMTADVDYTHNYRFKLALAKNSSAHEIYQDKNKLEVVAFIYNPDTKEVVNACKTMVQPYAAHTGVTDVTTTGSETPVAYYSVDGKRLNAPQQGMNIVRLSNGTSRKIFIK